MVTPPLLLLDVDGVLNALADDGGHQDAWPQWRSGYATADGSRWPITWAPAVVERLRGWHEDGRVEAYSANAALSRRASSLATSVPTEADSQMQSPLASE
jgi:hypothetical protein